MPHVREVTAPATIEFKSHEKEELDPVTGKIVRTRIIYPIITPKEKESTCISVPPLSEAKGQLNSLVPSPLAIKSVTIDGNTSTTMTPRAAYTSTYTLRSPGEACSGRQASERRRRP